MSQYRPPFSLDAAESLCSHGGDVYSVARAMRRKPEDFIDFSGNAHAYASPVTDRLIRETPYPYAHYPDIACADLREAIAAHEGTNNAHILAGNGVSELIWLAMQALSPRRVLFIGPVFSEYVRACQVADIPYDMLTPPAEQEFACGPAELRKIWDSGADLAVLSVPNNPAGVTYPNIQEMFGLLRVPRVIVDNSYREFLWGLPEYALNNRESYAAMARPGVTVFSMNSFSQFFACPGLLLGYLAGEPGQLKRMARIRPPWTVSAYAQIMGLRFFEHMEEYRGRLAAMRASGADTARSLRRMGCFDPDRVFEGPGFITAGLVPGLSAALVRDRLLRRGLIVRDCDGIPGMPPGYIRMQIRTTGETEPLLQTLDWHSERGW